MRTQTRYLPAAGNVDLRRRVRDRPAQAVGQQVGRAHLVHELRIDDPAAALRETLGLDQDKITFDRRRLGRVQPSQPRGGLAEA